MTSLLRHGEVVIIPPLIMEHLSKRPRQITKQHIQRRLPCLHHQHTILSSARALGRKAVRKNTARTAAANDDDIVLGLHGRGVGARSGHGAGGVDDAFGDGVGC